RAAFSKGFLEQGRSLARENVRIFGSILAEENSVVIGVEPSAILSFRDEYPEILRGEEQAVARQLADKVQTIEEFLFSEMRKNHIGPDSFDDQQRKIALHL